MPEMDTQSSLICHVCVANNTTISHQLILTSTAAYMCDFALINGYASSRRRMDIGAAGADWT